MDTTSRWLRSNITAKPMLNVLIPAFQAAIEVFLMKNNNLEKSKFPMPNWRITYLGIKNIPFINSQFAKFDILHA